MVFTQYDQPDYYSFVVNESSAQVLLLPRGRGSTEVDAEIAAAIADIRKIIAEATLNPKYKLERNLAGLHLSPRLARVPEFISRWKVRDYWKQAKRWRIDKEFDLRSYGDLAFLAGRYTAGIWASLPDLV